ncbi:hypothetical protein AALP_AA2G152700 [Arabis alpina]|uniref:Uncharacterized protein n=1 Tax=Arabis alpina TaxID=50452 RepID=A0A087HHM8_ARAAL|nr:hypothetical protein AALP_AA2G152700 [Arabis alpina]
MVTTAETPLLEEEYVIDAVDHAGLTAGRSKTGRWKAAWFIVGVEVAEGFAYFGIASNLISYLTGPLGQSTAVAAANVNAWFGVSTLLPVLGAFVADAFFGRYRTIIIAALINLLGLALLTLSASLVPITSEETEVTSRPSSLLSVLFFFSLYLVAIGQSGHKPCVQAFGADQFDEKDPKEKSERSSFFNWWYLGKAAGISLAIVVVGYIQEAFTWALGYGIPCVVMVFSLVIFVLGRRTYRNPGLSSSQLCQVQTEMEANPSQGCPERLSDVEDATALVRLIPIWLTTLAYTIAVAQFMTFFTKQGVTMERTIVPALVEAKRLKTAKEHGLIDQPKATVPMSIWWLIPQYLLLGLADVYTLVGMQEFFYSQVPTELRSIGLALYLSALGVGSLLSSLLISLIDVAAGGDIGNSRFNNEFGNPAVRFSPGGWKSARFIICVEMAERFAYYGISSNLITYLTGPLGESTAAAAANVNVWIGTVSFLPLLWAFVADSFLGRYRTIIISSSIYILGLGLLSFSAMIPSHYKDPNQLVSHASHFQVTLFFSALYLVAIGQGGYKPCIKVFGADQFDGSDLKEAKSKSSFFNWLMFGNCISILMSRLVSNYIQENLSWFLGFGIPSLSMLLALFMFLLGTTSYRFSTERGKKNPFARIGRVFVEAVKNRRQSDFGIDNPKETLLLLTHQSSKQFRFLDRATISCELAEIEEAKAVLRLVPIWMTCLVYAIVSAQSTTFFTKQGATMDRSISPGILVPAATLQCFISISLLIFIPIYDRLLVPIARSFTQNPSGFTMLQRIGTGISLSILMMVAAALVETKRLQAARADVTIPISVWWLIPQYVIYGVSEVFTAVGLQEFFYDQVPSELRSVAAADELGNPAVRCSSGGWKSARLIIGVEMAERFAHYGISSNLIMYLTGPLGESTAAAAAYVNIWIGTVSFLPLLWAFVADSFLGRYRTIIISSSIYILGLGLLTFSAMVPSQYKDPNQVVSSASQFQVYLFFCALYLVAIGEGGYKPCIKRGGKKNPFARIGNVFMEAVKSRRQADFDIANPDETLLRRTHQNSKQFRFLDRAAISCDLVEIEEAKAVLRLVPIWMTCLVYSIVCAQSATFFTKQGATMERSISPGLVVPAATPQCLINVSVVVFIPIYDRLHVPIARSFTQHPSGITMLQRIGTGIFLTTLSMVIAALVETKRLQAARDDFTIPITVWWLVPQYVVNGVSNVFTTVGLQEFFYDQIPCELRSVGMALNLSIFGVGNFLSSFLISVIDKVTSGSGQTSWLDNDLNQAHLDYFYWLLTCLSSIGLASYWWFAKSYVYNRSNTF